MRQIAEQGTVGIKAVRVGKAYSYLEECRAVAMLAGCPTIWAGAPPRRIGGFGNVVVPRPTA
jgi:hypothetical protein